MKPRLRFKPAAAIAHLRASDPALAALIDRIGPFALEIKPVDSLFAAMLRSITYQQLNGKAAATIHGRALAVLERHGGTVPEALAQASDADLRGAGLSRNKLLAVRDLAAKCLAGTVPSLAEAHRLGDE
jgi:3-methyladenine DNA glycosylase/8-oxoguanine DNA glycosylase